MPGPCECDIEPLDSTRKKLKILILPRIKPGTTICEELTDY